MSTVIYLANQQIQIISGLSGKNKVTISKCIMEEAPDGSIINGIVMDPDVFILFIKEIWAKHKLPAKDITMVINSTKFVGKTIEMPKAGKKKTMDYIQREFADFGSEVENVMGYIPLSGSNAKMNRLYAEQVELEYLQDYVSLFQKVGITVKNIYSGESGLIALTDATVGKKYKTFIMLLADKMTLSTLLWVDGSFYHFNSMRCFYEQGTEEYGMDVARAISQITQFMQANQVESQLEVAILAGITKEDAAIYRQVAEDTGIAVPVELFDPTIIAGGLRDNEEFLNAASGLIYGDSSRNFLEQIAKSKKRSSQSQNLLNKIYLVAGIFVTMLLITIILLVVSFSKKSELHHLQQYNNSATRQKQLKQYEKYTDRNDFLISQFDTIKDIDENLLTYPTCDENVWKRIHACGAGYSKVEFESFDAAEGIVTVKATAETVKKIHMFIQKLNGEDIFNKVDYTGYSYDDEKKLWDIHVTCTLAEAAGRE